MVLLNLTMNDIANVPKHLSHVTKGISAESMCTINKLLNAILEIYISPRHMNTDLHKVCQFSIPPRWQKKLTTRLFVLSLVVTIYGAII